MRGTHDRLPAEAGSPVQTIRTLASSASHHHSAIHAQHLAGDVRRVRAGKEADGGRDLMRFAEAAERNVGLYCFLQIVGQRLRHVGGDKPGSDHVARHALAGQFAGHALGEADQPCLAGGVVGLPCIAGHARHAADIDDPAGLGPHDRAGPPIESPRKRSSDSC